MKRINYMKIYSIINYKIYPNRKYYYKILYFVIFIMLLVWFLIQLYNTQINPTGYTFVDQMSDQELELFVKHLEDILRRYK